MLGKKENRKQHQLLIASGIILGFLAVPVATANYGIGFVMAVASIGSFLARDYID